MAHASLPLKAEGEQCSVRTRSRKALVYGGLSGLALPQPERLRARRALIPTNGGNGVRAFSCSVICVRHRADCHVSSSYAVVTSPRSVSGGPLMAYDGDFQITCRICDKPVKLGIDTAADEDGKAVHETCYTRQIVDALPSRPASPAVDLSSSRRFSTHYWS
jgi:hypothetical protein